jgi:hypothetical protein
MRQQWTWVGCWCVSTSSISSHAYIMYVEYATNNTIYIYDGANFQRRKSGGENSPQIVGFSRPFFDVWNFQPSLPQFLTEKSVTHTEISPPYSLVRLTKGRCPLAWSFVIRPVAHLICIWDCMRLYLPYGIVCQSDYPQIIRSNMLEIGVNRSNTMWSRGPMVVTRPSAHSRITNL